MKFLALILVGLSFAQVACAKPNYQDTAPLKQTSKPGAPACTVFFTTEQLCANYSWRKTPTENDFGSFALTFSQTDGTPADPKMALNVIIWMPAMGHGSSPVTITNTAVGINIVENVFFSMHGDWQIRVQLKNAAAVVEEQIFDETF